MFPSRLRRLLDDLVAAADVVLAYEVPPVEGVREVGAPDGCDRHALRRATNAAPRPDRRRGETAAVATVCVSPRR